MPQQYRQPSMCKSPSVVCFPHITPLRRFDLNFDLWLLVIVKRRDAPALSTDNEASAFSPSLPKVSDTTGATDGEQWDDEALAATLTRKGMISTASGTAELLDMKALDLKRNEQGDIAEKLRVEETRAQLAAAREGMEREAQRIKEQREKKEQEKQEGASRFGAAASGMASGGKWLPPHMRGGNTLARERLGLTSTGAHQKFDTQDENLFPDLAAAEAILEQQKNQQHAYKAPKKTPVGGGATWGSRHKVTDESIREGDPEEPASDAKEKAADAEPAKAETEPSQPAEEDVTSKEAEDTEVSNPSTNPDATSASKEPIKPKKKKKRDLSSFKPSA